MTGGYAHGPLNCRACFGPTEQILVLGDWHLQNNPGYYGSDAPQILVLGFSKGANQKKVAKDGDFDKIAFAKARHRLEKVLATLHVMPADRGIDAIMTANEKKFGVASLVRCSFCKMKGGTCKTSGDVIPSAFANDTTLQIIERCASRYLGTLPKSVRLVVLLGTADSYIAKTKVIFSKLHRDFEPVNPVAFRAGGALWIYAAHPSPGNGHFESWVSAGLESPSGKKRIFALHALDHAQPSLRGDRREAALLGSPSASPPGNPSS